MFTSRAEHRLLLREDNADRRLTATGRRLGLVDDERWQRYEIRQALLEREHTRLSGVMLVPGKVDEPAALAALGVPLSRAASLAELLRRPEVRYETLLALAGETAAVSDDIARQLEIDARYSGYIARQQQEIEQHRRHEETPLPESFDYLDVRGLSHEVRQKLSRHRPATLGEAARLSGITPAAISLLLIHIKRRRA
jgi:tRNA uridine 5-carboxymethylaminomethyl modification enzyme